MRIFALCSILVVGWTSSANADTFTFVTASATWSGTSQPGGTGLGADEIFNATFEWDVTTNSVVANSVIANSMGPVGPFLGSTIIQASSANFTDITGNNYVQIYVTDYPALHSGLSLFGVPGSYTFCAVGCSDGFFLAVPNSGLGFQTSVDSLVVTAAPEPGVGLLSLLGLASLGLILVMRKQKRPRLSRAA
jgi:hypothetical protein